MTQVTPVCTYCWLAPATREVLMPCDGNHSPTPSCRRASVLRMVDSGVLDADNRMIVDATEQRGWWHFGQVCNIHPEGMSYAAVRPLGSTDWPRAALE